MPILRQVDARRLDWARHVQDLVTRTYEGASERSARDDVFRRAFELTTPVATRVLERIDELYLSGTGSVSVTAPEDDEDEGLVGSWNLTWPKLEQAVNRFTGQPLPPVQIFAMFPREFTHGHLALFNSEFPRRWIACWPLQVTSPSDAERQEMTLWVIAEADVHDRTFAGDLNWRLLPMAEVASFAPS
jgi:hypothetical protein